MAVPSAAWHSQIVATSFAVSAKAVPRAALHSQIVAMGFAVPASPVLFAAWYWQIVLELCSLFPLAVPSAASLSQVLQ